jgi:hypothetical protein
MNERFLNVWELAVEDRDRVYARWLAAAIELMRSAGAIEREAFGEGCVIESLHEAMRICSRVERAPNLIGKVDPERFFWELVRIGAVFPDREKLPGRGRTLFTLFRVGAIRAICEKHGVTP